jgi:hypothetical protein
MKIKIFWTTVFVIAFIIQCMTINEHLKDEPTTKTGLVLNKVDYVMTTKHKSNLTTNGERVLYVRYETGVVEENVSLDTYCTTEIGETITFNVPSRPWDGRHGVLEGFYILVTAIMFFIQLLLVILAINYLVKRFIYDKHDDFFDVGE